MSFKFQRLIMIISVFAAVLLVGCGSETVSTDQTQKGFGTKIARITISDYGNIDVRLFADDSQQQYDRFLKHIEDGLYDGVPVKRIIDDFCVVISGNTTSEDKYDLSGIDGSGQTEGSKEDIEHRVYPIYGALCISNASFDTAGGEFMIIDSDKESVEELEEMLNYKGITLHEYLLNAYGTDLAEEQLDMFRQQGGAPWLYGKCAVIGQVFNGFDVLDKLTTQTVTADVSYTPLEEILVESVVLVNE